MNRKLIQMMLGDVSGFYSSDCDSGNKVCQIYNRCDIDFTLHSTYQDAMSNINPWQACRNVEYGSGVDMYTASNKMMELMLKLYIYMINRQILQRFKALQNMQTSEMALMENIDLLWSTILMIMNWNTLMIISYSVQCL